MKKSLRFLKHFGMIFGFSSAMPPVWGLYAMPFISKECPVWIFFIILAIHVLIVFGAAYATRDYDENYEKSFEKGFEKFQEIPNEEIILPAKNKNIDETFQFLDI